MAVDLRNSSDSFFAQQLDWSSPSLPHVSSASSTASLCSPLESELGSTGSETTESDHDAGDDYIVELTRQMADSMFSEFDDLMSTIHPAKNSIQEEADKLEKQGNFKGPVEQESNTNVNVNGVFIDSSPVSELQKKQALIDEQIRSVQLQRLKQDQTTRKPKQQQQQQGKGSRGNRSKNRALANEAANKGQNPSSWTTPPQQPRPAVTRAVFLGDPGRVGSAGTGVFLPRGTGNPTNPAESRKKPGYSTVLMPARVVQALKLHFDKMAAGTAASPLDPPPAAALPLPPHVTGDVRYAFLLQQKSQPASAKQSKNNQHRHKHYQDVGLPQEWTY
ncbi:unnamed protein product [Linum tenue]|uniref:Uncharacterized protein n=1 Tax=Linum tenue TaxID=586396 RepID=A0AAV0Q7N6_9ROSI|nr:unnamed protein product [Linum tenue]